MRNQDGTGCVCVSILEALLKEGTCEAGIGLVVRSEMESRASERKGSTARSMLSRDAFAFMRDMQAGSDAIAHVDTARLNAVRKRQRCSCSLLGKNIDNCGSWAHIGEGWEGEETISV